MNSDDQGGTPERTLRGRIATLLWLAWMAVSGPAVMGLLLFIAAGTLEWWQGWLLVLVFLAVTVFAVPYTWRKNPELLVARSRAHFPKGWDRVLGGFMFLSLGAVFVVAGLDGGRFQWLPVPAWVCAVGYALFLPAIAGAIWVGTVNKFAEAGVRVQAERGHTVVDTGPYAVVRHPGYVAAIAMFAGIALCLGSLWALLPAGLFSSLIILRTGWEDQTLQAELPGYKEYTLVVRSRLVPGVW
jgi:protein-S-isoprenylcysteine O-methyltransferase Ste14